MSHDQMEANCSQCFGLCCTALSFQRGTQFGHDKLAGQACQYLADDFGCRIHAQREALGYEGCEEFDCLGAGQRASAAFAGENWRRDPSVARRLYAHFSVLMRLQEMRQALLTAGSLPIGTALHDQRLELLSRIGSLADRRDVEGASASDEVLGDARAFLKSLAPLLA